MKLEQIFYGNVGTGYRILAASDPALTEKAAEICRTVGTPDGISELTPFLVSVPAASGKLFMARGCAGRADGVGRKTLFFHVIVCDRAEASCNGINAFSLSDSGRFSSGLPLGGATAFQIERLDDVSARNEPSWDGVPVRLARSRAANSEIRKMLGSRVNDVAWASFSFRNLEEPFMIYAVSEHTALPVAKRSTSPARRESAVPPNAKKGMASSVIWKCALALSLLLNVYFFFSSPRGNSESVIMDSQETRETRERELDNAREEWIQKGREAMLADLREALVKDYKFDEKKDKPKVSKLPEGGWQRKYVLFVNEKILKLQPEQKKDL